jgi:hypothetical protein
MYNAHRPPIGVPAPSANNRLNELLDQVRAEFDGQATRAVDYEQQRMFALLRFLLSFADAMSCAYPLRSRVRP